MVDLRIFDIFNGFIEFNNFDIQSDDYMYHLLNPIQLYNRFIVEPSSVRF